MESGAFLPTRLSERRSAEQKNRHAKGNGAITKGIGNDIVKKLITNVIANNFNSSMSYGVNSMISGNTFEAGISDYLGVDKPWYQKPWLQATSQAGVQTNLEVNDSRYQTMEKLLKKYENNPDLRPDFIKTNLSKMSLSMKLEFWQTSILVNIMNPDIYSLRNPIYTPPSILPTPSIKFRPNYKYKHHLNN